MLLLHACACVMQNGTELKLEVLHAAEAHLLLGKPAGIPVQCPVRVMHGLSDNLVPPEIPLAVANELQSSNVQLTLIKVSTAPV